MFYLSNMVSLLTSLATYPIWTPEFRTSWYLFLKIQLWSKFLSWPINLLAPVPSLWLPQWSVCVRSKGQSFHICISSYVSLPTQSSIRATILPPSSPAAIFPFLADFFPIFYKHATRKITIKKLRPGINSESS